MSAGADEFETNVSGPCPCGGMWSAAKSPKPGIIHLLPICAQFREMEPADYLAMVNRWVSDNLASRGSSASDW